MIPFWTRRSNDFDLVATVQTIARSPAYSCRYSFYAQGQVNYDRDLVVGSRTKGYMRYGGHWKPLKRSLYAYVCITNQHNASQACIYCFQKLSHPV
jgi:hypothetical protein